MTAKELEKRFEGTQKTNGHRLRDPIRAKEMIYRVLCAFKLQNEIHHRKLVDAIHGLTGVAVLIFLVLVWILIKIW